MSDSKNGYVLGLDIGVASVGWAIATRGPDGQPLGLLGLGSHLFEPGTDGGKGGSEAIAAGKDTPRNQARRTARLMRRQVWRRARRKRKLLRALIEHGLLPQAESPLQRPLDVDGYLKKLDATLAERWLAGKSHADHQRMPYLIRVAATTGRVELHEVGRALYHLAQRRGFLSNRRADAKRNNDEKPGEVKAAIEELQTKIDAHVPPTLGAYLGSLDPDEQRLRGRWTSREMFQKEFAAIWNEQARHHPLAPAARAEVYRTIFHQRPLKSQKNLIGRCTLIPGEARAPIANRLYQRFRVFQTVNNLSIRGVGEPDRRLTPQERDLLLERLLGSGDAKFPQIRKLLGLKKGATFNLEEGGEKRLVGHRTDGKLGQVFGTRWDELNAADRDRVVEDVRSFRLSEALVKRGQRRWGLSAEAAREFGRVTLEEGYASLSVPAMLRLMPLLEKGVEYATARRQLFPESFKSDAPRDDLPPVLGAVDELRNPSVIRALTEVRKLVNAIVRTHGKPSLIRVELAREVKNPRAVRERISKDNRQREKVREAAKDRILKEAGIGRPSRDDIEKVLLADECCWQCPYTGRGFEMRDLMGPQPSIDVEHIWPKSRSLDDSFLNKTLCYHEENRSRKRGRTPFEAYGRDAGWAEMLARVGRFRSDPKTRRIKLERFMAEDIPPDFANRHLSDTRYIARAAADYLALLFGGRADAEGTQRVQVCTGGLTAWLRSGWGLDRLLGDTGEKNRADHRHHAVDAVVVALSDPRAVSALSRAAESADRLGKRRAFESIEEPWEEFRAQVEAAIGSMVVSHRQGRKVSGPLHDQTVYSKPHGESHRVRKELFKLTPAEIKSGRVVDARALAAIQAKLAELGKPDPSPRDIEQILGDPKHAPLVKGADGKMVRLRKVRVDSGPGPVRIGKGPGERFVQTASNHHTVIYAELDATGNEKAWGDEPVTLLECYRRQAAKEPIVNREVGKGRKFKFSLAPGEHLEMNTPGDATKRAVYRVSSISRGDMELKLHMDGRTADELKQSKARVRVSGDRLRKLRARKVAVTYLGEVKNAGG